MGTFPQFTTYTSESVTLIIGTATFTISKRALYEGEYFQQLFDDPQLGSGFRNDDPIVLDPEHGVTASDMETFLHVLHTPIWGELKLTWEEWEVALRLASMWSFTKVKAYIKAQMEAQSTAVMPMEWIRLADQNDIPTWLIGAFELLCTRKDLISVEEGMQLGYRRFAAVTRLRERMRDNGYRCGRCMECRGAALGAVIPRGCAQDVFVRFRQLFRLEPDLLLVGI